MFTAIDATRYSDISKQKHHCKTYDVGEEKIYSSRSSYRRSSVRIICQKKAAGTNDEMMQDSPDRV